MSEKQEPTVMKEILELNGCHRFKEYCRKLRIMARKAEKGFVPPCLIISIDEGAGFTTLAELYARLLKELEFLSRSQNEIPLEHVLTKGNEKMNGAGSTLSLIEGSPGGVFAPDISDWLQNRLYDPYLQKILRAVWKRAANPSFCFIFKMPNVGAEVAEKVREAFDSVLNVELIRIDSPKIEEMSDYVAKRLKKFTPSGNPLPQNTVSLINSIILNKISGGRFFYYAAMNNLIRELNFSSAVAGFEERKPVSLKMLDEALVAALPENSGYGRTGREMLEELIGLEDVKSAIDEITASILFNKERGRLKGERPNLHMIFTGAPGTGKTIVARIAGKIFKEQGILETGDLLEVTRKDLVGEYIGQTAVKTASVCRAARGNVLFIDEAYALVNDTADRRDFGFEAVSALSTELENHRGEFVCIMAGYEEDMERLFELNPGLRSRFAYKIDYTNYSRKELAMIYFFQIKEQCFYDDDFENHVFKYFEGISKTAFEGKTFSNARFVRNLAERSIAKAFVRLYKEKEKPVSQKIRITAADFDEAAESKDIKQALGQNSKRAIGFTETLLT